MTPQIQCKPVPQLFIYPRILAGDEESSALLNEDGTELLNEDGETLISE